MQHNFQDFLRLGTHWIHSSQSIIKNLIKRDIVNQNLQDLYSQEYFDHFYDQPKQQNDDSIINSAVWKRQVDNQQKQILFSVQDQDYDSSQEFDQIESLEDYEIQSIKEINLQMEKMLENENDETQTQDQSENDVKSIQRNLQQISSQAEQNPMNSARTEKVLVIDKVVSDNDNATFNQSDMQPNFNFSKLGVVQNNFLINPYQARYSFDNQNYFNYAPEQIQDDFTVNRKGPYSVQDNQYYNNNVRMTRQVISRVSKINTRQRFAIIGNSLDTANLAKVVPSLTVSMNCKASNMFIRITKLNYANNFTSIFTAPTDEMLVLAFRNQQETGAKCKVTLREIETGYNLIKFETQSAKPKSKKNKDLLEGIFGKGKRLTVFADITSTNKDQCKKQIKSKNKSKKVHKFNKQHSENLTGFKGLDFFIESYNSPTPQLSARKPNKKKIIISSQDDKLQE